VSPIDPLEVERTIEKYFTRVRAVAIERAAKMRISDQIRRALMQSDFESAGAEGLLKAAQLQGNALKKAYADVSIRNAIFSFQRSQISHENAIERSRNTGINQPTWAAAQDEQSEVEASFQLWAFDKQLEPPNHVEATAPSTNNLEGDLLIVEALAESALDKLPNPLWRDLLRLRSKLALKGEKFLTWDEIAKQVNVSRTTAINEYNAARAFIRDISTGVALPVVVGSHSFIADNSRKECSSAREQWLLRQNSNSDPFHNIKVIPADDPIWFRESAPTLSTEEIERLIIAGDKPTMKMSRPVVFKGNRYDHPAYGTGVIKADWTPWGEGVDVLFRDGVTRNIPMDTRTFGLPLIGALTEKCATITSIFPELSNKKEEQKRAGKGAVRSKPLSASQIARIPDLNAPAIESLNDSNPFPKNGPSSSYGAYVQNSNWPHADALQPTSLHERIHYNPKTLIGDDASPIRPSIKASSSNLGKWPARSGPCRQLPTPENSEGSK
jgi:hypothetical protein